MCAKDKSSVPSELGTLDSLVLFPFSKEAEQYQECRELL